MSMKTARWSEEVIASSGGMPSQLIAGSSSVEAKIYNINSDLLNYAVSTHRPYCPGMTRVITEFLMK